MALWHQLLRLPYAYGLWARFPVGDVHTRVLHGVFDYPQYAYGVYWSAYLASRLGVPRISALELGVAGGRGLVALERASAEIGRALGVTIDVLGLDSGHGLPAPRDHRDLPHIWGEGFYRMDEPKLRARLTTARLVLGDVRDTVPRLLADARLAPIGFLAFDLNHYHSTTAALALLDGGAATHLPRVHCFFDDVAATNLGCMNEHVGSLLAIREFNDARATRKLARVENLRLARPRYEHWQAQIYVGHDFAHPDYAKLVVPPEPRHTELPL